MVIGKIAGAAGKIENDAGKITGKTIDVTGKTNQGTGKIHFSEDFSGETSETVEESETSRYRGQRGPDKRPRDFPLQTLKNLPQFGGKSHEEVRQHILAKRGVDIGGNFNLGSIIMPILIMSAIVAGGYGLYWLMKQFQKRREIQSDSFMIE